MDVTLTTSLREYYVLTQDKKCDFIRLGGHHGHRRLKEEVLSQKTVNFDLNEGFTNNWKDTLETQMNLNVFLKWMVLKAPDKDLQKVLNCAKFVCRKGVLSRMAVSKTGKDWTIFCERRGGSIFMYRVMRREDIKSKPSEKMNRDTYRGLRFEGYMVEDVEVPDNGEHIVGRLPTRSVMNSDLDVRMVVEASLENAEYSTKILLTGEADSVDSDERPVELKTMYKNTYERGFWRKNRGLDWWIQSHIAGIKDIVVGIRDDDGIVGKVVKLSLDELKDDSWNGDECLNCLLDTLKYIDENVKEGEAIYVGCSEGLLRRSNVDIKKSKVLTDDFKNHFGIK